MGGLLSLAMTAGAGIAGSLGNQAGYGIGEITGYNDALRKDQLEQQQALTNMQASANMGLMKESYKQQKNLWDETNAEAQIEHLKAAGLNPALMYAKGGSGGSTGGGSASVGGGQASSETERQMANNAQTGMGLQLMKMQSEIDLNKATANKLNTEADVQGNEGRTKLTAETNVANATVNEINNKIDNLKADTELKGEETKLNKLQQNATTISNSYNMDNNTTLLEQNIQILKELSAKANVAENTQQSLIETAKQSVKLMASQTLLNNSTIQLQEADKKLISAKIDEICNTIKISNGQLEINEATLEQNLNIAKMTNSTGIITKEARGLINSILGAFKGRTIYNQ